MAFDYKKEYKEFYLPKNEPQIVRIPSMNFLAVRGSGNPNEEAGDYKKAIEILYALAFTIKMSHKGSRKIDEYFEYVVPSWEPEYSHPVFWNRRRGAHGASVLLCALCAAFRRPAMLLPAGGRWPPLREGLICADAFRNRRRGAHWAPAFALYTPSGFPQTGNVASGGRPMAAPTRKPNLCGLLPEPP